MKPAGKMLRSVFKVLICGALRVFTFFLLLGILLRATGEIPQDVNDMLRYISKRGAEKPERVLETYRCFGAEGEEALIRMFFAFGDPARFPYLDAKTHGKFDAAAMTPFMEKLSEDKDFLPRRSWRLWKPAPGTGKATRINGFFPAMSACLCEA